MGAANGSHKSSGSSVVAHCAYPAYCIRMLGYRHLLLAGGGGAAKTGVTNNIDVYLCSIDDSDAASKFVLHATNSLKTDPYASMNIDIAPIGDASSAKLGAYRIAVGHDHYCTIYDTEFAVDEHHRLAFHIKQIRRFVSDMSPKDAYQKVCRFDRSSSARRLITAGADGFFRVWNLTDPVDAPPTICHHAHTGVIDDADISSDGRLLITVGHDAKTIIWNLEKCAELAVLPPAPAPMGVGYRVRACRITRLGTRGACIFVTAHVPMQRATKRELSYLTLWGWREEIGLKMFVCKMACKETISTLSVSDCGNYTAIGTMSGSVALFDTNDMRRLLYIPHTHDIFVTGVEFLPQHAPDIGDDAIDASIGIGADSRATIISLSADQTVQMHTLPYASANESSLSDFVLKLSAASALLYFGLWSIMQY